MDDKELFSSIRTITFKMRDSKIIFNIYYKQSFEIYFNLKTMKSEVCKDEPFIIAEDELRFLNQFIEKIPMTLRELQKQIYEIPMVRNEGDEG